MKTHATCKLMLAYLGIICCPIATAAGQTFLVGGSLFSDCADPLSSGVAGITVTISCDGGFTDSTTSFGGQGLYGIANVPEDTCTVTAIGFCYLSDATCPPDPCNDAVSITVNAANQGPNQSLAFWGACSDGTCDAGEDSCTCPQDCGTVCGDGCCNGGETITDCRDDCDPDCAGAPYLIGGAIFLDCADPLGSGVADMAVHVSCDRGYTCDTTSAGGQGLWSCDGVPCDTCTVTVSETCYVDGTCPPSSCISSAVITANDDNIAEIQSLTFWVPDPCGNGVCDADEDSCGCPQDCGPCDDGDPCTNDSCDTGVCVHVPIDCSHLNAPCIVGVCNATTGACEPQPSNEGGACDDGDACKENDTCSAGSCAGTPIDCGTQVCDPTDGVCVDCLSDGDCLGLNNACNVGVCNTETDACEAQPINEGGACDDSDACTENDICSAGGCAGTAIDCSHLDDACDVGTCNPATGVCEPQPANEGDPCDDLDVCTENDICTEGSCAGTAVDCSHLDDACNAGECNSTTGACEARSANEGGACDDGEACTENDTCTAGSCAGTAIICPPDDVCVDGVCRRSCDGVDGAPCEDGFFCTTNDTCIQGGCVPGPLDVDCVGTDCWDLDGDGIDDPEEDTNGDGVFDAFDCQGPPGNNGANGADGAPGSNGSDGTNGDDGENGQDGDDGEDGQPGAQGADGDNGQPGAPGADGRSGLSCWDLNGNGVADPDEDTNGDGNFDAFDCRPAEFELSVNRTAPGLGVTVPFETLLASAGEVILIPVPAAPEQGLEFLQWEGDVPAERIFDDPLLLTMDSDKDVTAVFQVIPDTTCTGACGAGCGCTPGAPAMLLIFIGLLGMRFVGASRPRRRDG